MDEAGWVTGQFVNQYDLTFPVSFLMDENGMIKKVHEGELSTAMLEEGVR